ncbi:hypothetical protein [Paraburkholderia diazotrophica]|uniref:hypothetical protein n=1 Tax=Paraburkholderia diazotrophica TaxID=667676 RepID=UPI0031730B09
MSQVTPAGNALVIAAAREFPYMPAREGRITPDRIANTATTAVLLKKGVETTVRQAVAAAWRKSGITVTTHDRLVLSGGIEALSVDDARPPAIWTITVRYVLTSASTKATVYVKSTTVHMYRQTFTNPTFALDDIVKLSIDALVRDPSFRDALQPMQ